MNVFGPLTYILSHFKDNRVLLEAAKLPKNFQLSVVRLKNMDPAIIGLILGAAAAFSIPLKF